MLDVRLCGAWNNRDNKMYTAPPNRTVFEPITAMTVTQNPYTG